MVDTPSHHLLITGTGRAGTSLLVRYLTGLGLDTHLSRRGNNSFWDETANAGLEDDLFHGDLSALPYVVKSPWTFETIDQILKRRDVKLDAVIVPMRDLMEAATSRAVIEHQGMLQKVPWMADLDRSWGSWGATAGGVVYSLNPLDQARVLAVGFHHLLLKLVESEIPVVLLAFPKFVDDPVYLFERLQPLLPLNTTQEFANTIFERVVSREKIRVGNEIRSSQGAGGQFPTHAEIDNMALRREIGNLRKELHQIRDKSYNATTQPEE